MTKKGRTLRDRTSRGWWRLLAGAELSEQRRLDRLVALAGKSEADLRELSDTELDERITEARTGEGFDDKQAAAWVALAREAADRELGERPFDVQLLGALRLMTGAIIEMATGEGKTLVGAIAASGYAAQGHRTQVITVNDYLARRDAEWMGPLYRRLGVEPGWIAGTSSADERRSAYRAPVCYLSVAEAGFDVLRDRQVTDPADLVVAEPDVAIVDEADSVLVDEARVPLVLAGEADAPPADARMARLVAELVEGEHYEVDGNRSSVFLTSAGSKEVSKRLDGIDLYGTEDGGATLTELNLALHAHALLQRDVHYLVGENGISLINPSRGRVASRQRWPDGLHAAVEAKEGVPHTTESSIVDSMTIHSVVSRYPTLCGMSGTAVAASEPLREFYSLHAAVVPPNSECVRVDEPDRIYVTAKQKEAAILEEIAQLHEEGRPVLVATLDVAESERVGELLADKGIECTVLNARNDAHEAAVIARAGAVGAVTVSTQMAGRGTDIRLGGPDETDHDKVAELGGLYVLLTAHQPSRRLDDQLRGRAGRQGDPGGSVCFTSLEDELLTQYGDRLPDAAAADPLGFIDGAAARRAVDHALEAQDDGQHTMLATTHRYNKPLDRQREHVGEQRDRLLTTDRAAELLKERCPDRYEEFAEVLDADRLTGLCRELVLFHFDRQWSEQLGLAADLRESATVRALAGRHDPLTEFIREMFEAFDGFLDRVIDAAAESFEELPVDKDVALEPAGLRRPSATWTYLVRDSPSGEGLERALRGLLGFRSRRSLDDEDED